MRRFLAVIAPILLTILGGFKFKTSASSPSSFHPRRLRVSFRDWTPIREHFLATRDIPGIKDVLPVGQVHHSWKKVTNPLWKKQWYAQDYRSAPGPVIDLNLVPVYRQGITGKGVTVAVVDNGVNGSHPDLVKNYWKEGSYDLKLRTKKVVLDKDDDLKQKFYKESSHGTECAGIIGMEAGNKHCGVGVAYDARIVDLKAVGKGNTDLHVGLAFAHKLDTIDIFSNSFGPTDDGKTTRKLNDATRAGLQKGVAKGRGGKGAIYVYASGNGGLLGDNCAADTEVNSNLTMAIAGASFRGRPLLYTEPCAAIFATAYAKSIPVLNEGAVTTVPGTGCSTSFYRTSAAVPIAFGMIALMLQAN